MPQWLTRQLGFALLAGAAGFVLNGFPLRFRDDLLFVFGNAFALLVLVRGTTVHGVLALAISALQTLLLWHHPLGLAISVVEGMVVGPLIRRGWRPLRADGLFWAVAGIPLLLVALNRGLSLPEGASLTVAVKYGINGLLNLLLVETALSLPVVARLTERLWGPLPALSLKFRVLKAFIVVTAIPLLLLTLVSSRIDGQRRLDDASAHLNEAAAEVASEVEGYVAEHERAVRAVADQVSAGVVDVANLSGTLARHHRVYPGFLTMLAADASGYIVAADPPLPRDDQGRPITRYVGDRPYVIEPMRTGRTYLSDAFLGRGFGSDPIVAVSAPVFDAAHTPVAVVEGSLDLGGFREVERFFSSVEHATVIVLDKQSRVVYASPELGFAPLQPMASDAMMTAHLAGRRLYSASDISHNSGASRLEERYLFGHGEATTLRWDVFVVQPERIVREELNRYYLLALVWLGAGIILSLFMAELYAKTVSASLEQVVGFLHDFERDGHRPGSRPVLVDAPTEVEQLADDVVDLSVRLAASYDALQQEIAQRRRLHAQLEELLVDLDNKVQERTASLETSRNEIRRQAAALEQHSTDLRVARDEALAASRAKSEFLATMSHEIRTPMNGVLGMAALLLDTSMTVDQRECAENIKASGEALLGIINGILDFSKAESGRLTLESEPFDPRLVVEDVIELMAEQAYRKGLELAGFVAPEVPRTLVGDAGKLRQVVLNLVGNAVKFTAEGHVEIRAMCQHCSEGESVLRIEVRDTGIGIPEPVQRQLFEPFAQADASTTRRFGGTGLGLAISKRLVELMGGSIGVRSVENLGSTFWFTLRLQAAQPVSPPATGPVDGLRVAVLAPRSDSASILVEHLAQVGCHVAAHSSAQQLSESVTDGWFGGAPDLLIVDAPPDALESQLRDLAAIKQVGGVPLAIAADIRLRKSVPRQRFAAIFPKPIRQTRLAALLAEAIEGLPAPSSLSAPAAGAPEPKAPPTPGAAVPRGRVLVAEDNVLNQTVAVKTLERLGYQADVARNGAEAVAMLERIPFDAVLMDCQMPEMDGFEATRTIRARENGRRTPILAMTASAMPGDLERCLESGMDACLPKPFSRADLASALDTWIRRTHVEPSAAD